MSRKRPSVEPLNSTALPVSVSTTRGEPTTVTGFPPMVLRLSTCHVTDWADALRTPKNRKNAIVQSVACFLNNGSFGKSESPPSRRRGGCAIKKMPPFLCWRRRGREARKPDRAHRLSQLVALDERYLETIILPYVASTLRGGHNSPPKLGGEAGAKRRRGGSEAATFKIARVEPPRESSLRSDSLPLLT